MNKLFTSLFALSTSVSMAQIAIPNSDFEKFKIDYLVGDTSAVNWDSRSSIAIKMLGGQESSVKVIFGDAFSGQNALRIKNVYASLMDTTFGGLATSTLDIKGKQLPAYLKGHIKYNLVQGEKAIVSFGYKTISDDGIVTIYALGNKFFEGTTASYVPFKVNTNSFFYTGRKSDSLQIIITSYNYWSKNISTISDKSSIIIDSLGFVGQVQNPIITANNVISNGDFATWNDVEGVKVPASWYVNGLLQDVSTTQLTQSIDGQNDKSALQLGIDPNGSPTGVYTFFKPSSGSKFVNGFVKFDLAKDDTVIAYVTKYSKLNGLDGDILDSMVFTGSQASYKAFSLKFDGKVTAGDTLSLQFNAYNPSQFSNFRSEATSIFLLDNVTLGTTPLSIDKEVESNGSLNVSPNPSASGLFTIVSEKKLGNLKVYNSMGTEFFAIMNEKGNSATIDISQNPQGVYFLIQESEGRKTSTKLVY